MNILILSYKRANNVITGKYLKTAKIVVPNSQVEEYKRYNDNEIIGIDDSKDGDICKKRNAALDLFNDDTVLMDDDIKNIGYNQDGTGSFYLSEERFVNFAKNAFEMSREIGTVLWGLNQNYDPLNYKSYSPLSLTSCVLGPVMGISKENKLRFDLELTLKEDYDFSLQVLFQYRKILRFNKYHYIAGHIDNTGGVVSYRTMEKELWQAKRLQQKWGSKVVKIERNTQRGGQTINPKIISPL